MASHGRLRHPPTDLSPVRAGHRHVDLLVIARDAPPLTNSIARAILIGGLFVVLAGGTLLLHLARGVETARGDGGVTGPNLRVMQSYAALVGFIYFLQLLIALAVGIYLVFALVAPGVFGSFGSSRSGTLAILFDLVYVMLASGFIVAAHSSIGPRIAAARAAATTPDAQSRPPPAVSGEPSPLLVSGWAGSR